MVKLSRFINYIQNYIIDFFTKGHQRSLKAKRNITATFIIKGVSIAANLILVPVTINYVNPSQYGIWLTLSSIVAWFSFFDIGFGNGLRNRFAEAIATGKVEKARIYVSTTYAALAVIFLGVWILFFMVNFFVDWSKILNAPPFMAEELSALALIVFSFFCLEFVLRTINTIVTANQKPALAGFFNTLGQLLALTVIFILTKTTKGSLINLGLALGFIPVFVLCVSSIILFKKKYKSYAPNIKYIKFKYTKDIMALGIKFFLIQVSTIVIFQTSNIVITQILGPESVTVYNIAYKYFFALGMMFLIILSPFWSAFTEAYAKKEFSWMKRAIKKLERIWLLLIPIVFIMVILSDKVYKIWIGDEVSIPFMLSIAMAFNIIFFTRYNIYIMLINGIGKLKLQLIVIITICFFFFPIAIYSLKLLGLNGLVLTNIFINIIFAILGEIQISKILNEKATGIWNK